MERGSPSTPAPTTAQNMCRQAVNTVPVQQVSTMQQCFWSASTSLTCGLAGRSGCGAGRPRCSCGHMVEKAEVNDSPGWEISAGAIGRVAIHHTRTGSRLRRAGRSKGRWLWHAETASTGALSLFISLLQLPILACFSIGHDFLCISRIRFGHGTFSYSICLGASLIA